MSAKRKGSPKKDSPKRVLRLPDLDHSKRTVLDSLGSPDSARAYAFAMNDFIAWYCSEPRLAFSKHVVLRYRIELESRRLSASTINLRLAAVRRLAGAYHRYRSLRRFHAAAFDRAKLSRTAGWNYSGCQLGSVAS
jgi:hypothetical protein